MSPRRLEDFAGRWRLDRRITNRMGADAVFSGTAVFSDIPGGLLLHESGEMRLEGGALRAERSYRWLDRAGGVRVCFDDGRDFHTVDLALPQPEARHDCAPDVYRVRYDFSAWPVWHAVWHVTGPRKDYILTSRYRR